MKKLALITGAAKRIGAELAKGLAEDGYDLILHYNQSKKEIHELKQVIEKKNDCNIELIQANLADLNCIKNLAPVFNREIDLLINNASCFPQRDFLEESVESFHENMNTNFASPLFLCQHYLKSQKNGHIINFLDCNVVKHHSFHPIYLFAKKNLAHLTTFIAVTYGPNFRCNAIAPGYILDPSEAPRTTAERQEKFKSIPLQSQGDPMQLLQGIRYLISTPYVTGQTLYLDGGSRLL